MHLDIFNDDAFSLVNLTRAIQDTPYAPSRVAELGLFTEEGINTTTFSLEKTGSSISLVPTAPRGAPGKPMGNDKRQMIPFTTVHLPQSANVMADEVQNLRPFGKESELELASNVMNKKLAKMRRDLDSTIEYQRIGAIKGQVLDADGSVLLDLHQSFGTTQQTFNMVLNNAATKAQQKTVQLKRAIEKQLGGLMYTGIRALCSPSFFDMLTGHASVEKAFDRWQNGEFFRNGDYRGGFWFANVMWEEYRGTINGTDFVADGTALVVPEGVADLFGTFYAPANYGETVNTQGLPYYAKQEPMKFNKGVEVESQSNPIHICTRPQVPVVLSAQ